MTNNDLSVSKTIYTKSFMIASYFYLLHMEVQSKCPPTLKSSGPLSEIQMLFRSYFHKQMWKDKIYKSKENNPRQLITG